MTSVKDTCVCCIREGGDDRRDEKSLPPCGSGLGAGGGLAGPICSSDDQLATTGEVGLRGLGGGLRCHTRIASLRRAVVCRMGRLGCWEISWPQEPAM